jgi:hypothetical protein
VVLVRRVVLVAITVGLSGYSRPVVFSWLTL